MASVYRLPSFHAATNELSIDGNFTGLHRKPMESVMMNGSPLRLIRQKDTHWRSLGTVRTYFEVMATKDPCGLGQELKKSDRRHDLKDNDLDPLKEFEGRFLKFKKQDYLENLDHYQNLAQGQSPKFMVIACADSRVCPSKILGFQPGEAFTVRNVANLVPPYQVSNILVVGHSCCGGIRALMSMKQKSNSKSFIRDWVSLAKSARLSTEAAVGNLSFEKQCTHCEKVESINGSLLNLLTYPWIEERVTEAVLSLHGGYYDFTDCSFEKWTLVYRESLEGGSKFAIKGCSTWS
ncbi:hypothetical protein IEQ34_015802 [Dendrobium chrysotoxum]|uniref:Carbonic anhydrase n=1 Tax=Dendrobium chrysotoxum TaxID=161865 RepID=A0AAV7GHN9_DENCH|nr:hypothetical protein IEQ34_015802 [Dendrobium chrysotoxum]